MSKQETSSMTYDSLFAAYHNALAWGCYGSALSAADELCRPERARETVDYLADPLATEAFGDAPRAMVQPLLDRVQLVNARVREREARDERQAEINDARWGRGNWG